MQSRVIRFLGLLTMTSVLLYGASSPAANEGARSKAEPERTTPQRVAVDKGNPALDSLDAYNVVWNSPSENSHGSMPLGNGDIGINAWVEKNGDLVFYISKTDAWDENARLCKIGRVRVKFDPPLAVKDSYRQELKLRDGVIAIKSKIQNEPSTVLL